MSVSDEDDPKLSFDHNVVEHLGIKLYANKPTKVLAELVSNSWDADANGVWVEFGYDGEKQIVVIADDGHGMSLSEIKKSYLVIGKPKRKKATDKTEGGRRPMGRKGIGKLAPFGVARTIEIATIRDSRASHFRLELAGIEKVSDNGVYKPPFEQRDVPADKLVAFGNELVDQHLKTLKAKGRGTIIVLRDLTSNNPIDDVEIARSLGQRLNVILLRDDFRVSVNGKVIDTALALPSFDLRIPEDGFLTESVDGKEVRYWAGFVRAAEWPPEQAGVGVYAHGKIAQDRPFFFAARGKEVFQRYLYASVEADWLDEQDRDLVSTDRTALDWSDPVALPLYQWGQKKVRQWLEAYTTQRRESSAGEVAELAKERRESADIPTFSEPENKAVEQLVVDATQELGKGPEAERARDQLLKAVSSAWVNLPSRKLIKEIWADIEGSDPITIGALVSKLHNHSVPEAMGLALTFAQRAYALSILHNLVHKKSEVDLQALVEEFPWIIQPRGELLTADKWLKTTIEKAADESDDKDRIGRSVRGMTPQERADFVFLTNNGQKRIQIVEIKAPGHQLTLDEDRQLIDYIHFTRTFHSSAEITGLLVGKPGNPPYRSDLPQIRVVGWEEILDECRASYIQLLAAMLEIADLSEKDSRFQFVKEFGGDAVWELLTRLAERDERLQDLFKRFPAGGKVPLMDETEAAE